VDLSLDGYRTTRVLRSSPSTRVFAAIRESDQREVVAKVYDLVDDRSLEARVEHEFRLIRDLEVDNVVRALALERAGTKIVVVLDWCAGVNLDEFANGKPLPLELFLNIALQISRVLADVHAQRVIHRDIKPTNILIDPATHAVSLADFGISVLLESERERINDPSVVAGTLPYVSPEQTGRTHREVDFRSDLYSLGVTFYELLTGRRPFSGHSPLELIHAHLARRPDPPQWLRADIPTPLSSIVMKLLEKAPERRYQSARGLRFDLERLAAALREGRGLDQFELGQHDVPMTLQLPHRLYGRGIETELLAREYKRASKGEPRFVLITGPAGIGKTALIEQLAEPVMSRQGFLARGRFARDRSDKPYSGFTLAFDDLVEQLLTETDEQLGFWRREFEQTLGPLLSAMCELIPKLRTIVGPTPSSTDFGPAEAHNRTALACVRFVAVFARVEHPLALALDDIQFADRASCELLGQLLAEPQTSLLVLVSMRMDELTGGHPLREVIDEIEQERDQTLWLDLGPLGRREVAALISDALASTPDRVASLATLIGRKSNHNPLFIRQFMAHLVDLRLLRATAEGWTWDEQAIELAGIPNTLLDMLTEKLERLDEGPREVLSVAAVIGPSFDLATLELAAGAKYLGRGLVRLVEEGLVTVTGVSRYAFTHDRIREVAYQLIPLARRCELHREIGRHRLERAELSPGSGQEATELSDALFELVDHVDRGYGLLALVDEQSEAAAVRAALALPEIDVEQRWRLAELNSLAGYKMLNGGAPATAVGYLEAGVRLLEYERSFPTPGTAGHDLRIWLELGLCQALSLSGRRQPAERRFDALLQHPVAPGDYGYIVAKRIECHILASDRRAALLAGLAGLRELGFPIDIDHARAEAGAAIVRLLPRLRMRELRQLATRPRANDQHATAAMQILMMLGSAAAFVDRTLHVTLVATHVDLLLRHGLHVSAPLALGNVALLLSVGLGRRDLALELIELATELAAGEEPACMRHRIEPPRWLIKSWRRPYAEALEPIRVAAAEAVEAGDIEFASHATAMHVSLGLVAGLHLRAFERSSEVAVHRLRQWDASSVLPIVGASLDFARLLMSGDVELLALPDPLGLDALARDSAELRPARLELCLLHVQLLFLFERHADAWAVLQRDRDEIERHAIGAWLLGGLLEVEGLLAASRFQSVGLRERAKLLWVLERNARRLRRAARQGTVAFESSSLLLEAELEILRGSFQRALELFAQARRSAATQRSPLAEAITLERMGIHAHARGLDDLALGPLREARARFHYWGAFTKVAALERRWPQLASDAPIAVNLREPGVERTSTQSGVTGSISGAPTGRTLDMASVLKTSQAIAADIRLDEVVGRVMALTLENAGADRGALVLRRDGRTGIVAISTADRPLQNFLREPLPLDQAETRVPISLLHFVERTREPAIFDDISTDLRFASDRYVEQQQVRSAMCLPILKQNHYVGLLYLENKLSPGSFTRERIEVLQLLVGQAASALENAQLYERLRASEVRWRSLVEGLPDIVLLVDREGRIEFINHVEEHTGRRFIGEFAGAFIDPEHLPALRQATAEVVRDAEHRELELRGKFGATDCWYITRLAPIVVDGRVERIIAVGTDITEKREAASKNAMLEATLRQQQRLESIGTLASGVAHEINNPVQGIMNYAELIATSPDVSATTREFAEEIGLESERVATIVRNLLAFSRQEGDRAAAPAKLGNIVEGTLSLIRTVLRKDQIQLEIAIPPELPPVSCRVQQIQQVLMNLVTNARDAVTNRWGEYHDNKRIEITGGGFERDGEPWVRLSVHDHGGGVPESVVPFIFDPFFTTKGRDRGTGLGLAVSHGILKEHDGDLRLENHPGEGATFHIELPTRT
jgi:predicted ATPase/signal transduction histidine kinase/tRNA A-37 threonylcarbamoyl transferase component Bud32